MSEIKKIYDKKLEIKYNVKVSIVDVNKAIDEEVVKEQPKIKIDGFRKGKVPFDFIKDKYSATLLSQVAENLVESNIQDIIKKNDYKLILRPEINVKNLKLNEDFEFEVTFNLYPKIPDIKFEKIKLKRKKIKIEDSEIEKNKNRIIKSKLQWIEQDKNYTSKIGDKVKIDFLGKVDGVAFEGGEGKDYSLELGSKSFIDNFEDQLVGKKADDEVNVKVKFPKDYHQKTLSGKSAIFEVKIHSVSCVEKKDLNDDFYKTNFNLDNEEKFIEMIKKELSKSYENLSKNKLKSDIFKWFEDNIDFDIPNKLIDEEFNKQWKSKENLKFDDEKAKQKEMESIRENSENSIKLGLIMADIGRTNNIEVKDTEVIDEIRKIASAYPGQESMIAEFYMKNENMLNQLTSVLLENKVIDFVISKINIVDEETTIDKFN